MSRLVDVASRALAARTSRRGFLRRAAVAGSAIVTAPAVYALRPVTAFQAITTPGDCPPGSNCRVGWTELCCRLHGVNTCPPGSVVGGWWRAEASTDDGFCGGGSRYYMDCHAESCGSCGCGYSGTCGNDCVDYDCHCAGDDCSRWRTGCTRFRYGQCNNQIACIGPIQCRVVTCVPPWEWDSTCARTDARADSTRHHDASCLHRQCERMRARPAVVRGSLWMLRTTLTSGNATSSFDLGLDGDVPLTGDWTGAGVATAAMVRGVRHGVAGEGALTWMLRHIEGGGQPDLVFTYGRTGDIPVAGDWTGTCRDTVGVVRGNRWMLRTRNAPGAPDIEFTYGQAGDIPVVGDWDGDGRDGIGIVRGTTWLLRNTPTPGPAQITLDLGEAGGMPVVGDWDNDGRDEPGWFRNGAWTTLSDLDDPSSVRSFSFGEAGDRPVTWRRRFG